MFTAYGSTESQDRTRHHDSGARREAVPDGVVQAAQKMAARDKKVLEAQEACELAEHIQNDPFLTHLSEARRARPEGSAARAACCAMNETEARQPQRGPSRRAEQPFLSHTGGPFLAHTGGAQRLLPHPPPGAANELPKKATPRVSIGDRVMRALGPGDRSRKGSDVIALVIAPWALFVWLMLVWVFFRHRSETSCILMTVALAIPSTACCVFWRSSHRGVPLGALGLMMLIAIEAGAVSGINAWRWGGWRQYWWWQTGYKYYGTSAEQPALSVGDASLLGFRVNTSDEWSGLVNGSRVDTEKSAGFRRKDIFCVAPLLDISSALAGDDDLVRVNYWAIGVNCCENAGSFTCDDSRDARGGFGLVMVDGLSYECDGCEEQAFRDAVEKAEALYGFVSAPGALYVRWVRDPSELKLAFLGRGWYYLLGCSVLGLAILAPTGLAIWYYGFGKPGKRPWYEEGQAAQGDRPELLPKTMPPPAAQDLQPRLHAFYLQYHPEKAADAARVARDFLGKEELLNARLRARYDGRDLGSVHVSTANDAYRRGGV